MIKEYGKVIEKALIKDYTTYKLSGTIKEVIYPNSLNDLISLLKYLKQNNQKYMIIGNGSNLIFTKDYDGTLIKLDNFNNLEIKDNIVTVEAGYNLMKLALKTAKLGLSGLEFASGIPATIGGAVYMNAGAYNKDMASIIESVTVIDENFKIKKLLLKDLKFDYRKSIFQNKNYICISVTLKLEYKNKEEILKLIKERKKRRLETQPLEYPSAGSVFRNPKDDFAGRLIEEANLKGTKIGDAMISLKHANFIINVGCASGQDVKELIELVSKEVYEKYKVKLITEQKIIE